MTDPRSVWYTLWMADEQIKPTEINIKMVDEDVIRHLEELLKKAKTGELTGIIYICQWHGYNFSNGMVGISTSYIRTTVGELEILKQKFISNNA